MIEVGIFAHLRSVVPILDRREFSVTGAPARRASDRPLGLLAAELEDEATRALRDLQDTVTEIRAKSNQ